MSPRRSGSEGGRGDDGFDGKAFVATLSTAPGVYRMLAADGAVLYVGKAASLRKRVANYFSATPKPTRIMAMVAQIADIEVTATRTEAEALLLENQLIKSLKPRYNVMLRDDKSYPYVLLTQQDWPRLAFHRGPRGIPGRYFGPYPSASSVRETLNVMHKLFRLRSCEDSVFRNRSRPCLQFQIGRCSAPCVGMVDADDYAQAVRRATLFLDGRSGELNEELAQAMEQASADLEFERAAALRDLLATIRGLQARQYVDGNIADLDVLAVAMQGTQACVLLLAFRDGRNLGTRAFFPKTAGSDDPAEVLAAFVSQYYAEQTPPREIVLDRAIEDVPLLQEAFSLAAGRRVQIKTSVRSERAGYVDLARRNAGMALAARIDSQSAQAARLEALRELLGLDTAPQRIECFDISHTMGEATVASCVVFDGEGPVRGQYRRYNITDVTPGDDYAAMHQALTRRFRRAAIALGLVPSDADADKGAAAGDAAGNAAGAAAVGSGAAAGSGADDTGAPAGSDGTGGAGDADAQQGETAVTGGRPDRSARARARGAGKSPRVARADAILPDVLLIDGGAGQVAQARDVLQALGISGVMLVGVAKGEARRAGHEALLLPDGREIRPGPDSAGLQLVQQVRDEAHRFAITGHRGRRQKARSVSRLEDIPGIGPRRRANLLRHFGGLAGLKAAGAEEIAQVDGVNAALARRIYDSLHGLDSAS
ncbi:excinuclease ABC subunit UvrC [Luteimonas abyssi]|uniref:excinuclease ABC subunit UvrC n=1 Tax=Luteimonas abyssi TaxID=1247514 RepID=UPI000737C5DB|nr:excinuclease ABC subunit UvrC [Luteimonas abyssi]